jgi:Fibronectin type III domain.
MHLFGDRDKPHLVHFEAQRERGSVVLTWDVRNAPALSWRVLRSERGFAETADALPGSGQTVVMEGADTRVTDDQLAEGTTYYYAVFAQEEPGAWHRLVKVKLKSHEHGDWTYSRSDSSPLLSELELRMPRGR